MEINKINKIEQLVGRDSGNPYWRLETDKGRMSCFDKDIADKLYEAWRANEAVYVDATASKDGKYVNIRRLMTPKENEDYEEATRNYEATYPEKVMKPQDSSAPIHQPVKPQDLGKPDVTDEVPKYVSMYVSYAKDIFISMMEKADSKAMPQAADMMQASINLVKQAHKAFS